MGRQDGRVQEWLFEVFNVSAESVPLARWSAQYIFLGSVWRTMQPGVKQDETPVLIGKGGIGKSSTLRHLLPTDHRDMFSDALRFTSDDKSRVEALQGKLIVEAAEMTGATRAETDAIKSFLSRTDDGAIRLAYRRNPERMPRRCIVVGTTLTVTAHCPMTTTCAVSCQSTSPAATPPLCGNTLTLTGFNCGPKPCSLYRQGVDAWLPPGLKRLQKDCYRQCPFKEHGPRGCH